MGASAQARLQTLYEAVRDAKNRRKGVGGGRDLTSFEQGQARFCFNPSPSTLQRKPYMPTP